MNELKTVKSFWNEKWAKVQLENSTKETDYYISNYGKLKSVNRISSEEKLLKGSRLARGGYRTLNIRLKDKKNCSIYVHKFIAEHFVPKGDEARDFVVHIDGIRDNNYYENLKWLTRAELSKWWEETGVYTSKKKPHGKNYKMTETRVRLLRQRVKSGKTKKKIIAKDFGITLVHLNRIVKGEYWGHVKD